MDESQKVDTFSELWSKKYVADIQSEMSKTNIGVNISFGKSYGNQYSPFCCLLLSFGRCVASLALRWWNCTSVVECHAKEERCEGEEM